MMLIVMTASLRRGDRLVAAQRIEQSSRPGRGARRRVFAARRRLPSAADRTARRFMSIVVLPFLNLSGDPQQDRISDGITDSLTTDLVAGDPRQLRRLPRHRVRI